MAFLSCEEMLAAARSQKITLAEAVLRSDLEESRLTEAHSRAAMRHLWQVMQATSQEYDPTQRSRSGLSGGDAAKVEQAWQQGRLLGDDYLAAVTAEALKTAECNACMKRIVAAPTAGLHFTPELMAAIEAKGAKFAAVELEVGIDTFRLVEEDDPTQHVMHTERYHVSQEVVDAVHKAKAEGHRVIAVGTTAVRSLESAFDVDAPVSDPAVTARYFEGREDGADTLGRGDIVVRENATTQLYLMPGSTYHVVDALITNFHVPRSTLMMLVSALATRDQIMDAYAAAIEERYRFFSFGDAMLIC